MKKNKKNCDLLHSKKLRAEDLTKLAEAIENYQSNSEEEAKQLFERLYEQLTELWYDIVLQSRQTEDVEMKGLLEIDALYIRNVLAILKAKFKFVLSP